jgi:ectoine hydroxylase-related dioxygenase (phytanoyl-CoA dioxygenase family)
MERGAYGVREAAVAGDAIDRHAERIRLVGYTIVPSNLPPAFVADVSRRLDALLERQTAAFGRDNMAAIGDAGTVRCPLAEDGVFLQLATHADILALCRRLIGDYVVLMQQNGIVTAPQQPHTQMAHHRDLPYQHFTSSRPLAVSALFCIDPFREETGATSVIPGSHRLEHYPSPEVAAALDSPLEAPPGSFLVFDAMLFHRAGHNRSAQPRRAVNHVYTIPLIAQQISLPDALGGRYADDPGMARLLGYDAAPSRSAVEWRRRRLARAARVTP